MGARCIMAVCDQPLGSTQPGHPTVERYCEYWAKVANAVQLGSTAMYGLCLVTGKTCGPCNICSVSEFL